MFSTFCSIIVIFDSKIFFKFVLVENNTLYTYFFLHKWFCYSTMLVYLAKQNCISAKVINTEIFGHLLEWPD